MAQQDTRRIGGVNIPPQPKQKGQIFPNFPYDRKFTRDEIEDILQRAGRLGDAMRDGLGPNGAVLFIPGDLFEMWMIHGALAGVEVNEDAAYIRARKLPDTNGRLAGSVDWVLKKDDTSETRAADAEREANAHIEAMERSLQDLRPEVRDAVRRRLAAAADDAAEYLADHPNGPARADAPKDFGTPRLIKIRPDDEQEGDQP